MQRNVDGDLIITINMSGTHQLQNQLRDVLDVIYNATICQAQAKALVRMKEANDKARIGAYIDIEFGSFNITSSCVRLLIFNSLLNSMAQQNLLASILTSLSSAPQSEPK